MIPNKIRFQSSENKCAGATLFSAFAVGSVVVVVVAFVGGQWKTSAELCERTLNGSHLTVSKKNIQCVYNKLARIWSGK